MAITLPQPLRQYWLQQSERLLWSQQPTQADDVSFNKEDLHIRWFDDGQLNASVNCLDRHLASIGQQTAIIWEGDDATEQRKLSYIELHQATCQLSHLLEQQGVKKGDVVTLYMPMVPEAVIAMLACARIGAIHSVIFGGFSPDSIAGRIHDAHSKFVITANEGIRAGKTIPLKASVDEALENPQAAHVEKVIVLARTDNAVPMKSGRDICWQQAIEGLPTEHQPQSMAAEDPLFILYTSGSTGKPKGLLHTTGGYLTYVAASFAEVFQYKSAEVYWCTADVGWITGHSYMVYGPLANGATILMHEGVPNWPTVDRIDQIIERHQVNILYTAPTLIRSLMVYGSEPHQSYRNDSLRLLGTVGEPINPEAWHWYHATIGKGRCDIVDTWWQTETGGICISPNLNNAQCQKPGCATTPLYGIEAALMDKSGHELSGVADGNLVLKTSWPGQARTIYGDHQRFFETYFSAYPGYYFTGDGARRDDAEHYWITGRVDDVINVSGHRLGTAEIESSLVAHPATAEAAVVGFPHDIKGQGIYAYVTLKCGIEATDELNQALKDWVRKQIGALACPDKIQWAPTLPKTRSGKIMRRFLRKIAAGELENMGDASTLSDPTVIADLIKNAADEALVP